MHQQIFADVPFEQYRKPTRREQFLNEMHRVVPWADLVAVLEPVYPKADGPGQPPSYSNLELPLFSGGDVRNVTGRFKTVEEARRKPNTSVVEQMPKPGYGTRKQHTNYLPVRKARIDPGPGLFPLGRRHVCTQRISCMVWSTHKQKRHSSLPSRSREHQLHSSSIFLKLTSGPVSVSIMPPRCELSSKERSP